MSLPEAAPFEFGARPVKRLVTIVLAAFGAKKANGLRHDLIDVLGVIRPVGGNIQCAVTVETAVNQREEFRLYDPALVMTFFGPRVWEVEVDAG